MKIQGKIVFDKNKVKESNILNAFFNLHFAGWSFNQQTVIKFWFSQKELNKLTYSLREVDSRTTYISYLRIWYDIEEVLPKVDSIYTTSNFVETMNIHRTSIVESIYDFKNEVWSVSVGNDFKVKWWSPLIQSNSSEL